MGGWLAGDLQSVLPFVNDLLLPWRGRVHTQEDMLAWMKAIREGGLATAAKGWFVAEARHYTVKEVGLGAGVSFLCGVGWEMVLELISCPSLNS